MRHIENVDRPNFVCNLPHPRKIPQPWIRARSADNRLRLFPQRNRLEFVVVDHLGIPPNRVERGAIKLAAETELVAVCQVTAMRQIQTQNGIARLQHRHVRAGIRLRPGVRLHVRKLCIKNLLRPIARQVLHHIGVLASAVITPSRIPLGIFIGEDRTRSLQHRLGDKVLARNHLQPLVLAKRFVINGGCYFRISLGKGKGHAVGHIRILRHLCL